MVASAPRKMGRERGWQPPRAGRAVAQRPPRRVVEGKGIGFVVEAAGQPGHEPDAGRVSGGQVRFGDQRRVGHQQQTARRGQGAQGLEQFVRLGAFVTSAVGDPPKQRETRRGGGVGDLELAAMGLTIRGMAEADARRGAVLVGVGAAERHRREVPMQPGGIDAEPADGGQRHRGGDLIEAASQHVERSAEPVVVQQAGGGAQPLVGGVGRGPIGHVIQRARRGEPIGDQRGDHLAVSELGPAPHRAGPIHDAGHVQARQHRSHQRQRADQVATRSRVQAGERGGQVVQRAGVLQPVAAAQVCHNTVTDLADLVAVALHDVHVLVDPAAPTNLLNPYIHFPNTLRHIPPQPADPTICGLESFPNSRRLPRTQRLAATNDSPSTNTPGRTHRAAATP